MTKEVLLQFVRCLRLAWAGHECIADGFPIKMVMVNQIHPKTPRRLPRQGLLDVVRNDLGKLRPDWNRNSDLAYALLYVKYRVSDHKNYIETFSTVQ